MPPFSSIKRSMRRRRRKLENRKRKASNPAARKRNPRKRRLQPERRDLPCALSGHFVCQVLLRCSCRRHRRQNIQLIQILPPETAAATTSLLRVGTRQRAYLH